MTDLITLRPAPSAVIGQQLYALLPGVYRDRDNTSATELGDLGKYVDACGELLDLVYGTLAQRLGDSFPDNPPEGQRATQQWLLPYFAQLVDVRLMSPDTMGQRDEVANAVAWRQRKGTLACIEEIAEAVGRIEVEVQEGWRRVATTPRIGIPLPPARSLGVDPTQATPGGGRELRFDPRRPVDMARHPGLPAATVDVRIHSRAVRSDITNPAAHETKFGDATIYWRQANHHGVPCAPGSYQDVSRRTVDTRSADWSRGLIHARRVLLFAPPPRGFFGDLECTEIDAPVTIAEGTLAHAVVRGTVNVDQAGVVIDGCAIQNLVVTATVGDATAPTVRIRNSLFDTITATGLIEMEYCTVLNSADFKRLNASECIFAGTLTVDPPGSGCIRFSRVPADATGTNTAAAPLFQEFLFCDPGPKPGTTHPVRRRPAFGESGCGVLDLATSPAVRFGAEDGGEMGAYHAPAYALRMHAVVDKIADFLPAGMSAVLIADPTLHQAPHPGREVDL